MNLKQIQKQIKLLRKQEAEIISVQRNKLLKEKNTLQIDTEKRTWGKKKPGSLHRTTLWRRLKTNK